MKQQLYRDEHDVYDTGLKALTNNKPSKDYINYLTLFTNDELTTGKINKPANYAAQRAKLIKVMQHKYLDHGFRQTISKLDFDSAQFHELLFAMHFITHEIEITNNIGYDKGEIAPGVYRAKPIAYIEYKIVDKNLMDEIKQRSSDTVKANTPTPPTDIVLSWESRVHKDGRLVLVSITGDDTYAIKKLSEDGTYDKFMDYILNNKNATEKFADGNILTKKDILLSIGQNPVLYQGKLQITPNEWLEPVRNNAKSLRDRLDKVRTLPEQMKKASEEAICLEWLGMRDSNPRSRDQNPLPYHLANSH